MLEDLHYTMMQVESYYNTKPLIKIKVTSEFAAYLSSVCKDEMLYEASDIPQGIYGAWTGIPVVIDNDIEHPYYELVFEKENNNG